MEKMSRVKREETWKRGEAWKRVCRKRRARWKRSAWRGEVSRDGCRSQTLVKARQRQKARRGAERDGASKRKRRIEERWRGDVLTRGHGDERTRRGERRWRRPRRHEAG